MEIAPHKKSWFVLHVILFLAFVGLTTYVTLRYGPEITRLIRHPEKFKHFLETYGSTSALIFILLQAAHIIIVIIPGELVQIGGGYVFGTALGTLYALIGLILGTLIVFGATRLCGYSLVKAFVPAHHIERFNFLINSPKAEITMFVLFLLPGFPKDALLYIAGLTPVRPLSFLVICTLARLPGLWGSAYIGANLHEKHYLPVWIMSGVALVLFVGGLLTKDKIVDRIHRLKHHGHHDDPAGSVAKKNVT